MASRSDVERALAQAGIQKILHALPPEHEAMIRISPKDYLIVMEHRGQGMDVLDSVIADVQRIESKVFVTMPVRKGDEYLCWVLVEGSIREQAVYDTAVSCFMSLGVSVMPVGGEQTKGQENPLRFPVDFVEPFLTVKSLNVRG